MLPNKGNNRLTQSRLATMGLNPAVRAFILSESLFWASWNLVVPLFAVFVVQDIAGGTVAQAATGLTVYLLVRMVVELVVSRKSGELSNAQRAVIDVLGMVVVSIAYLIMATTPTFGAVLAFYALAGLGFGISSPVKYSLFSRSLEPQKEASVWGFYDVATLSSMAIATMLGGLIAQQYGFKVLFLLSAALNIIGAIPYFFFIRWWRRG